MDNEPTNRDWVEEAMLEKLDFCKYDIRVRCPDAEVKDYEFCDRNPDSGKLAIAH